MYKGIRVLPWEAASVIQKQILNIKNSCWLAAGLFDLDSILDSQLVPLPPCVLSYTAVSALLVGTAIANPFPPSVTVKHDAPTKIAHYTPKFPSGGNYMPSRASRHTTKSPRPLKRETSERVHNTNLANYNANYNANNIKDGVGGGNDSYTMYSGDGSTSAGWPSKSRWVSFEDMFNNYKSTMLNSCAWNGWGPNNSGPEVVSKARLPIDHRFILAVVMQESSGCVRAPTTNYGVRNPGLMQDHNGAASCNDAGKVHNACPSDTIYQMISEGTAGTDDGDGLANCINGAGRDDVAAFYRAARIYNSGSVSSTGQLQDGIATHCYASDIANRLTVWVGAASKCTCDSDPGSCGTKTN
ncbi:glycoside hydrolase [Metarhizium guizhouense ARSEF 977]|uniref:Glycoside hydrolase n=1 Tax=Metarhizium guizhouense (strain ARSEF 977) TaxID=1276136 RepID=A0A0B4G8D5_METGA|nr:glycoside hydrolase [Metarhizium guizhouense ARSEF 977]